MNATVCRARVPTVPYTIPVDWTPTPDNIKRLPVPVQAYVLHLEHGLGGDELRELAQLRIENKQLHATVQALQDSQL